MRRLIDALADDTDFFIEQVQLTAIVFDNSDDVTIWATTFFDQEPAMDPRIQSTRTTMLDVAPNVTSKEAYTYDLFNNKTEIVEYDFGESTALRKTATKRRSNLSKHQIEKISRKTT